MEGGSFIIGGMIYEKIVSGIFIDRPNRFIAHVEIDGKVETVHVKNTGRCRELLVPGCRVILEDFAERSEMGGRKTRYDLIAVYKKIEKSHPLYKDSEYLLINMDSQAPNKVVMEYLIRNGEYDFIKPEYVFGDSRIDFYMEKRFSKEEADKNECLGKLESGGMQKYLMEVKGCTLERNGIGFFPDAPTERGVKHLHELIDACASGYICYLAFVIQVPGVKKVLANIETHKEFGQALQEAEAAGVKILFLECDVFENELKIKD